MTKKSNQQPVFVTEDKAILNHDTGKMDPSDIAILKNAKEGDGIVIRSREDFEALLKMAADHRDEFSRICNEYMAQEHAMYVRALRKAGFSWRAIARTCHYEITKRNPVPFWKGWPTWYPPSNQIMGIVLCERAAAILGENPEEDPWR